MLFTATTIATVMQSCTREELQRQPKFVLFVVYVVIVPLCIVIPSVRIYNGRKRQQQTQQPCECFQEDRPIATRIVCNLDSSNHCRSNVAPSTILRRNALGNYWSVTDSSTFSKPIPTNHTNFFVRLDIVNVLLILIALLSNPIEQETGRGIVISFYSFDTGLVLDNTKHFDKLCVIFILQIILYLLFSIIPSLVFVSCKHVLPRRITNHIYSQIQKYQLNFCLQSWFYPKFSL